MTIDTWLAIAAGLLALAAWWHGRAGRSSQEGAARPSDAPGTSHVPGIAGTRPGYRRILSAAELLQLTGGDRLIDRLLRESRLPPALFERDLLVALQRCAALVQLLPAGLEDPQGDPGGLLRRTLERTLHALALRAGHVLPRQAGAERVDAHRDAWTCAVFLGALLHGLGEPLTSLRIDLCGAGEGESIPWQPGAGTMAAQGAVQYAIAVVPADERDVQARRRMGALLFERVAPPSAVAFLTRFVEVGDALDDFLAGRAPDGELAALLAEADRLAGGPPQHRAAAVSTDPVMAPLLPEPVRALPHATAAAEPRPIASPRAAASSKRHTRAVGSREPSPVARDFLAWLRAGLTSGEVACNGAGAPVHIVEEGLALVSPAVFRHYASRYEDPAEVASRTGQASLDRMGLSIQREVLRSGMHEPNPADGSNFWAFELLGGDGAVAGMLSVVLLPAASPWTSAKAAVNPALRRKAAASTAP